MSAKQFNRGLRKGQYEIDGCFRCKVDGQHIFLHCHVFGQTRGDQPISKSLESECLQDFKMKFSQVFDELNFPIIHDDSVHFEHKIRLENEGVLPPHHKIYHLDQEELTELKRQITDMLSKNQIRPSDNLYGATILFKKKKDGRLRLCVDYRELNKNTIAESCSLLRIDELLSRL